MFTARSASVLLLNSACGLSTFGISDGDPGSASQPTGSATALTTTGEPPTSTISPPATATTGTPEACQDPPECQVGEIEDGVLCGGCGVMRRTCQSDCTWTPVTCMEALDTCAYWLLPEDAKEWQRIPVDPTAPFAPTTTVRAATDLGPQKQIYVFTSSTFHVLDVTTRTWTSAGNLDTLFPHITGKQLWWVHSITIDPPDTVVSLAAGDDAFAYKFTDATKTFTLDIQTPCCGASWDAPDAPASPDAPRDAWSRLGDPDSWLPGDPKTLCELTDPSPVYAYSAYITNENIYSQDLGYCFDFYAPTPYALFTPFSYPGAPDSALIGGAASLDGLWIFRGE